MQNEKRQLCLCHSHSIHVNRELSFLLEAGHGADEAPRVCQPVGRVAFAAVDDRPQMRVPLGAHLQCLEMGALRLWPGIYVKFTFLVREQKILFCLVSVLAGIILVNSSSGFRFVIWRADYYTNRTLSTCTHYRLDARPSLTVMRKSQTGESVR